MKYLIKKEQKFKNFKKVESILRIRPSTKTRHGKIRLDKNERISEFEISFLNKIKKKITSEYFTTYPEVEPLYDVLSKKLRIKKDMLVLTAGSDMAIRNCFELFVKSGDQVITIYPTYGMVDVYAKLFEAKQVKINYEKNLKLDVKKLINTISHKTKLVIIANPNAPTGTIIEKELIIDILKKAKKFNSYVLIDECYYGFYKTTTIPQLKKFSNLIISRSFSKIFGLAGCRVGLLIANTFIAEKLYKFRPMYEINSIAVMILKEMLKNKKIFENYIADTAKGKIYLIKALKKLGLLFYNSYANFILVDFKNEKLKNMIWSFYLNKKFLITGEPKIPGCKNVLRFTLGPEKYMKLVVNGLEKFKKYY